MDAFEKELENQIEIVANAEAAAGDNSTKWEMYGRRQAFLQIKKLYRSPSIKADRLAGALEEVANKEEKTGNWEDAHLLTLHAERVRREAARAIREQK